jgi:RNA polymerase sigma-70 factor (ECF subfamily)
MQRSTTRRGKNVDAFALVHPEDDPGGQEEATTAHEIWERVGTLPDKQREAIMLVYAEDMNHAEAAVIMGCKEATVSWHIHEAKKTLRGLL